MGFDVLVDIILLLRAHNLLSVQVVADVVVLVVPFHGDVTNRIARLLYVITLLGNHFIIGREIVHMDATQLIFGQFGVSFGIVRRISLFFFLIS